MQLPIHSAVLFLKCELALCQRILFPRKTGKAIASWTSFGVIHGLLRLCSALSCRQFHQRCFIHCYPFGNVSFISVIFTVFEGPRGLKCLQTFLSDVHANGTPAKHRRIHASHYFTEWNTRQSSNIKKIKVRTTNDDDGQNIASLDPNQHEIWKCKWEKAGLIKQWKERNNALFRKALTFLDRMLEVVACGN